MLDKPLVAFDIETIPDPDIGRRVYGLAGADAEVIREMVHKRREETDGKTDYPQSPFHRIACVCVTIVRDARVEIRQLPGDGEHGIIESFHALVRELSPRLVTWNGNGFDVPVLRYRAMLQGVAAPGFYDHPHVDVMTELSSHGASSHAGLSNVSRLLQLPGKSFLDRAVWEHWVDGDSARVIEYCKLDTALTMLVFLNWAFHAGHMNRAQTLSIIGWVRDAIAREPFEGWRAIHESLASWPHWGRSSS